MLMVWLTGLAVMVAFLVLASWQFKVACDQDDAR